MPRKKKGDEPKPYPSAPGERGLLLRWWRERHDEVEDEERPRDEDEPIGRDRTAGHRAAAR
jgi:hypothetical protein